jgi:glycine hydroxymethyltransferase
MMNDMNQYDITKKQDKEVYEALAGETTRQQEGLELIPSENYVSHAVKEALASDFTNKYAEGYPGKRYYGGQEYTDKIETLAIERAKELFGALYANVQPLSGAPANLAVYSALLKPGDTVLGMELSHGGHLTHGHPVTLPAKLYRFVRYGVSDIATGEIDYQQLEALAEKEKPKILLAGFSSYTRSLDYTRFVAIAQKVGAISVIDSAHIAGLIAGKALPNPFDAGFDIMTATTHKTLRGPRGGLILVRDNAELAQKINFAVFPGLQGGPHMNTIAGKAVAFGEAGESSFAEYAQQVLKNAKAMERVFIKNGVTLIGGGTDNHMLLIDVVASFGIGGKEAQEILDALALTVNMNIIPNDERSPRNPSGIRLGTPALTTRGATEADSIQVAEWIVAVLKDPQSDHSKIKEEVAILAKRLPLP